MDDIFGVFLKNLARFDWIILVLAAVNAIVYCTTRARIERIYYHFNRQDHFTNLCEDAKTSIRAHTRAEQKQLTAGELLSCREAMNRQLDELGVDRDRMDIFATHLHSDHVGLAPELIRPGCQILMGEIGF